MAVLDCKDAYYSVAIPGLCLWVSYISLMLTQNGLACALRLFPKLMKPAFAVLRRLKFCCCRHQFINNMTRELAIHDAKSCKPSRRVKFLGFIINSDCEHDP